MGKLFLMLIIASMASTTKSRMPDVLERASILRAGQLTGSQDHRQLAECEWWCSKRTCLDPGCRGCGDSIGCSATIQAEPAESAHAEAINNGATGNVADSAQVETVEDGAAERVTSRYEKTVHAGDGVAEVSSIKGDVLQSSLSSHPSSADAKDGTSVKDLATQDPPSTPVETEVTVPRKAAGDAPNCVMCDNVRLEPYMTKHSITCATWAWAHEHRCALDATWKAKRYCAQSCFDNGNGYDTGGCCPQAALGEVVDSSAPSRWKEVATPSTRAGPVRVDSQGESLASISDRVIDALRTMPLAAECPTDGESCLEQRCCINPHAKCVRIADNTPACIPVPDIIRQCRRRGVVCKELMQCAGADEECTFVGI